MKLSLRLISLLAVAITIVTFIVAWGQVRSEKRALRVDLERRAEVLAESLQETIEPMVIRGPSPQLRRIVERFGNRERLAGVAVYDAEGKLMAMTSRLTPLVTSAPVIAEHSLAQNVGTGGYLTIGPTLMYVYAMPLHKDTDVSGTVVLFHEAAYVEAQSAQIWRDALWHVVTLVLLIMLITLMVIRWTIVAPIQRAAQWMKDLRTGKIPAQAQPFAEDFLGPLSSEALRLARNLSQARAAAIEEARLREAGDSLWTRERLRASIHRRLGGHPLFVVSNREPYQHVFGSKGIECLVPASGLVTALEPVMAACDGTWIAHGSGEADRDTVDASNRIRVPPDNPHYTLRRVWLSKEEEEGYYLGFANEGIWPLCHIAHTRPTFRAADWEHYQRVNEKFAEAVLEELVDAEQPHVLIQDYHFALLPKLIKAQRPDAKVAIFWHIPWPNPDAFAICPWQGELLDGLLGADLVSFHIQAHCTNFLETVDQALECRIEWDRHTVNRNDHFTLVRPHPISVALPQNTAAIPPHEQDRAEILAKCGPDVLFVGIGVDRIDYTKGIIERFRGIECFLERYPYYLERFAFIQFGAPSRTNIGRYRDFVTEVREEAERINRRFQSDRWRPIVLLDRYHSHEEIAPYYRAADICVVTSLHDGMNLVAKEFVVSRQDQDGVLILSKFTGASRELRDALLVNPYDVEQVAETIRRALEMSIEERQMRMERMRRVVREHNVYRWAAELILELSEVRLDVAQPAEAQPAEAPDTSQ